MKSRPKANELLDSLHSSDSSAATIPIPIHVLHTRTTYDMTHVLKDVSATTMDSCMHTYMLCPAIAGLVCVRVQVAGRVLMCVCATSVVINNTIIMALFCHKYLHVSKS